MTPSIKESIIALHPINFLENFACDDWNRTCLIHISGKNGIIEINI